MKDLLNHPFLKKLEQHTEVLVGILMLFIVILIIIPLPTILLDIFLALNVALSILILMLSIFSKSVLDFSVFPTMLLVSTLFRLGLNISSTRLILSKGNPGEVITSMGELITQGDLVVGSVVFIIICIVQFMVITNGSSRVAEVSARFALDSMPGAQMSIDADLSAGVIDDKEAKRRRSAIQAKSSFYGAMDGASKFVKGDAIAGIIIVLINFIGGILIFSMKGYDVMEAIQKFGLLTIGDGLVSAFPSLLISSATGLMITKTESEESLGENLKDQLLSVPKALMLASGVMIAFAFLPALPFLPFMLLGVWLGITAYLMNEKEKEKAEIMMNQDREEAMARAEEQQESDGDVSKFLRVELFEIEFGYGLLSMVKESKGQQLSQRIEKVRKQFVQELGIIVPAIAIRDNVRLKNNEYVIKIKGNKVASGELYPDKMMVFNIDSTALDFECIEAIDPSFKLPSIWIDKKYKMKVENMGYSAIDEATVLLTHLKEVVSAHAYELFGRQQLKEMLDVVKEYQPDVVGDLIPDVLSLGDVIKVSKGLLRERVSIRDMGTILETLADCASVTKDTEILTEYVRASMSRKVVAPYLNREGVLEVIALDLELERMLERTMQKAFQGSYFAVDEITRSAVMKSIQTNIGLATRVQKKPVVLVSPSCRPAFRRMIEIDFPSLAVLSVNDVPQNVQINAIGRIDIKDV